MEWRLNILEANIRFAPSSEDDDEENDYGGDVVVVNDDDDDDDDDPLFVLYINVKHRGVFTKN